MEDPILITKYDIGDSVNIKFHNGIVYIFKIFEINYIKSIDEEDNTVFFDLNYGLKRQTPFGQETLYLNQDEILSHHVDNFM